MGEARYMVERFYDAFASADWEGARECFAEDCEFETPLGPHGVEAHIQIAQGFYRAFPDTRMEIVSMIEVGDTVAVEGKYEGTHTGPMLMPDGTEIAPTNRTIDLRYADITTVRDGRIVAHRTYWDQLGLAAQLGLLPEPAAAP